MEACCLFQLANGQQAIRNIHSFEPRRVFTPQSCWRAFLHPLPPLESGGRSNKGRKQNKFRTISSTRIFRCQQFRTVVLKNCPHVASKYSRTTFVCAPLHRRKTSPSGSCFSRYPRHCAIPTVTTRYLVAGRKWSRLRKPSRKLIL